MCKFKSGIILKNRVVLAPMYNDSHSALLESMNIEDTQENAMRKFVRAELVPPHKFDMNVDKWEFTVDQDVIPEWYEEDPKRYEDEFRAAVKEFVEQNFVVMAGHTWVKFKESGIGTYYILFDKITSMRFGDSNNYSESEARKYLMESELLERLKEEVGDKLVPITSDLTSLDGLDDYGKTEGDLLSLMSYDLYRECRKNIPSSNGWWWLSTPFSTKSNGCSRFVCCVRSDGSVYWDVCDYSDGVRPFCIL